MDLILEKLLATLPKAARDSLDQDTLEYLGGIAEEDGADYDSLRDAAEPFLSDAGMTEQELDSMFSKLAIASSTDDVSKDSQGPVLLPTAIAASATITKPKKVEPPNPAPAETSKPSSSVIKKEPAKKTVKPTLPTVQAYSQQSRFHNETLTTLSTDVDLRDVNLLVGESELLMDARLWLKAGQHYGMVGRNGVGKSTLLSVIGDKSLIGFPENIRTLYVQQLDVVNSEGPVVDAVLAADKERHKRMVDVQAIETALNNPEKLKLALNAYIERIAGERTLEQQKIAILRSGRRGKTARNTALDMEANAVADLRKSLYQGGKSDSEVAANVMATLYSELDAMDAHSAESRARATLDDLGFDEDMQNLPISRLSGGWRMRVALAKVIFLEPDLVLLDECTNHLDIAAVAWLQDYLSNIEDITIVCVSHDRDFLNAVSREIIRLKDRKLTYHPGNYDDYEQTEDELRIKKERQFAVLEKRREMVKKSIEGFISHARSTKDDKVLGQVASRKKKLERLVGLDKTEDGKRFKVSYWAGFHDTLRPEFKLERSEKGVDFIIPTPESLRNAGPLVGIEGVSFAYPDDRLKASTEWPLPVVNNVSLSIMMGDHIALVGLNGCGKSTLINLIKGDLLPTKGSIEYQPRMRIAHYTQHFVDELTSESKSALKMFMNKHAGLKESEARKWLGSFELSGPLATRPVNTLSGGQRARAAMALMLYDSPHLLLLDEVTNHLDMYAVQALISAINEYEGTVILVSHDRHFIRETSEDIYNIQDGKLTWLEDDLDSYVNSVLVD